METLRKSVPVLFSPKFWGLLLYSVLSYLQTKGWIGGQEVEILTQLVMLATGVKILDSAATKIGGLRSK